MQFPEQLKLLTTVIGMGVQVDHEALDPAGGDAYVLLKMKVEDARQLAAGLNSPLAIQVLLQKVQDEGAPR